MPPVARGVVREPAGDVGNGEWQMRKVQEGEGGVGRGRVVGLGDEIPGLQGV